MLTHYADALDKLAAARFLIMNMPGHTGADWCNIEILQLVYAKHVGISEKYHRESSSEWYKEIGTLWMKEKFKIIRSLTSPRQDVETIKARLAYQ